MAAPGQLIYLLDIQGFILLGFDVDIDPQTLRLSLLHEEVTSGFAPLAPLTIPTRVSSSWLPVIIDIVAVDDSDRREDLPDIRIRHGRKESQCAQGIAIAISTAGNGKKVILARRKLNGIEAAPKSAGTGGRHWSNVPGEPPI